MLNAQYLKVQCQPDCNGEQHSIKCVYHPIHTLKIRHCVTCKCGD